MALVERHDEQCGLSEASVVRKVHESHIHRGGVADDDVGAVVSRIAIWIVVEGKFTGRARCSSQEHQSEQDGEFHFFAFLSTRKGFFFVGDSSQ